MYDHFIARFGFHRMRIPKLDLDPHRTKLQLLVHQTEAFANDPVNVLAPMNRIDWFAGHGSFAAGIVRQVAQERLGHSSVSITLDIYSSVLPGLQTEAADRVDAALRAALHRRTSASGEGNR